MLRQMGSRLGEGGRIIISVPNFGHWYPRVRTALGIFDYDQRGILDKTHVRFFTRRSLLRMIKLFATAGWLLPVLALVLNRLACSESRSSTTRSTSTCRRCWS